MTNCNANATNSIAKPTNSTAKPTNSIAKPTNSIANGTNSIAIPTNSIAIPTNSIANGTNSIAKATNSIAKTCKTNILEHLNSNNLLTSHQFGFLEGHSCTTQLLHVMDILTKSLDRGVPVDAVIYKDLQKAFDSVPHKRLLYKIEH